MQGAIEPSLRDHSSGVKMALRLSTIQWRDCSPSGLYHREPGPPQPMDTLPFSPIPEMCRGRWVRTSEGWELGLATVSEVIDSVGHLGH